MHYPRAGGLAHRHFQSQRSIRSHSQPSGRPTWRVHRNAAGPAQSGTLEAPGRGAREVVACFLWVGLCLVIIAGVAALVLEIFGFSTLTQIYSFNQGAETLHASPAGP